MPPIAQSAPAGRVVLVVDDNLIMRRLVRAALQPEGYSVLEATSGANALQRVAESSVDLILQDMLLPDMDGAVLVQRLRDKLQGRPTPIIALSGFEARLVQARTLHGGFDDYLFKPVPPSLLVQVVSRHLAPVSAIQAGAEERHVLLADDNAIQRRLVEIQLSRAGFSVATAEDGLKALDAARKRAPDLIVSDVLMPGMDGFNLCRAVRNDPALAKVPVLLMSNAYVEQEDRRLALQAGANNLILRTPGATSFLEEVQRCLAAGALSKPKTKRDLPVEAYTQRALHQLERQAGLNIRLADRIAILEAQVAVLAELYNALQEQTAPGAATRKILTCGLNAFGVSQGIALLLEADGHFGPAADVDYPRATVRRLEDVVNQPAATRALIALDEPVALPGEGLPRDLTDRLLHAIGVSELLVAPLVSATQNLGLFLIPLEELREGADWMAFARAVGASVGQAILLARSLEALARSETLYRTIVNTANEAITVVDAEGRTSFVNPRYEELFGRRASEILGRSFLEVIHPDVRDDIQANFLRSIVSGAGAQREVLGVRGDGSTVSFLASVSGLRDAKNRPAGVVAMLTDLTTRKRMEEELLELSRGLEARVEQRTSELSIAREAAEAERATLSAVMANMSDGLLVIDEDWRVRYCNRRAAELLTIDQAAIGGEYIGTIGAQLARQLPSDQTLPDAWVNGLKEPGGSEPFELGFTSPRRDVQFQFFAPATADDETPIAGLILRDVTSERDLARTKDELVSVVSHELRTPLASVVGFTELLLDGEHTEEEQRLYLSTIGEEGRRLTALINDFLDLERMSSGRQEYRKVAVDVRAAVKQALTAAGEDPTHPSAIDVAADIPAVLVDADALQQVLTNLISNARKYSPSGGEVRVAAAQHGQHVELSVADQGLGLPAEAMSQLFTAFYRVDNSDRRAIKGTGLGLSISRKIVEEHGGRIWAESEGSGTGSRFAFTLPVAGGRGH